jgi:hypothetical protein
LETSYSAKTDELQQLQQSAVGDKFWSIT